MATESLLRSSVYQWLTSTYESQLPAPCDIYSLADGEFLNKFMSNIAPAHFTVSRLNRDVGDDARLRVDNLNLLLRNMTLYYEEQLGSVLVTALPDIRLIGTQPYDYQSPTELEKILDLMLGVAVQCDQKDIYVEKLLRLPEEVQGDLMLKIKNVTENQDIVYSSVSSHNLQLDELKTVYDNVTRYLKGLATERNDLHERYIKASQERDEYLSMSQLGATNKGRRSTISINDSFSDRDSRPTTPAQSAEVTELRQRIHNVEDELVQKSDELLRVQDEAKAYHDQIAKLKNENRNLYEDAQSARIYRDELDILREKADKLDKYESDIAKYRDKLEDMEYTKKRLKEEKEKCQVLEETNDLLKEELAACADIQGALISEEEKNIAMKRQLEEMRAEKEYCDRVIQDLRNNKKLMEIEVNHSSSMITQMQQEITDLTTQNSEYRLLLLEKDSDSAVGYLHLEKELGDHDKMGGMTPIVDKWKNVTKDAIHEEHNEAMNSKIKRLEMDNGHLKKQVDNLKELNHKLQQLEERNQEYQLTTSNKQSEITRLADEIILGKTKTDALQAKLTEAYDLLKQMGIDTEKLSEARPVSDRQKFLEYEERLKAGMERDLKTKGERVSILEDLWPIISTLHHQSPPSPQIIKYVQLTDSVLEERLEDTRSTNTSLRKELDIIKKQNKSFKGKNRSLQQSLDESMASIQKNSPTKRRSQGVQYDHATSLTSTPIKQRASTAIAPGGVNSYLNFSNSSGIELKETDDAPNEKAAVKAADDSLLDKFTGSSEILDVSYDERSLNESQVAMLLLKQDVEELKDENERLFTEKEQLEQEIVNFNNTQTRQVKEIKTLKNQTADLMKELDDLQLEMNDAQAEVCKMAELHATCSELEAQLDQARMLIRRLEDEKNISAGETNKLLIENQQMMIRTLEEREKNREQQRTYQEHLSSLKQDNEHLSMTLAMNQKEDSKKKGFLTTLFNKNKTNKNKALRDDGERTGPTPRIDDYLDQLGGGQHDQLSLDSGRITPPEYIENNGFFNPHHHEFPESDNSSRTMSGDRASYDRGSEGSLARVQESGQGQYRGRGISRTMSTDNDMRRDNESRRGPLQRTASTRSKKSDSYNDLVPRVEPRNMSRPIPPGTLHHRQHDRSQVLDRTMERSHLAAPSPQSNRSVLSSSLSTTAPVAPETPRSISAEPSAFRTVNQSLSRPPDTRPRSAGQNGYNHNSPHHNSTHSSRGYNGDTSSQRGYNGDTSSQRGLHDEDIENSTYYEYGCV